MRRWLAVLSGLGVGMIAGCLLELDLRASCGDGHHDARFEECDPGLPTSFEAECETNEVASCDALTCELRCASCGDGVLDPGEACEGDLRLTLPPCQESICVGCQVVCPRCGNGQIDPGEDCDVEFEAISTMPTACEDLAVPGLSDRKWEAGGTLFCRVSDCKWDLSGCSLCGDGVANGVINVPGAPKPAELCDGEDFDEIQRESSCASECGSGQDCVATCGESCYEILTGDCCLLPDEPRSANVPCCCELPDFQHRDYCGGVITPPGSESSDDGPDDTCPR